jgi:hypothetical protein
MALKAASMAALALGAHGAFQCTSDVTLPMVLPAQKGLALDDTTFHWCPDQIPGTWPNTNEPVSTVRIFKAWEADWTEVDKHTAWQAIAKYVKEVNAKALVGTQISCSEAADDADWADVSELLKLLGPDHVMGLAVGNEVDLLWQNQGTPADCVQKMWQGGYFQKKILQRIEAIDAMEGFANAQTLVTTVLSEFSLAGSPFVDDPSKAMVNTLLKAITTNHATRFVFSLNNYPYFDSSNQYLQPDVAIKRDTCFVDSDISAGVPCLFPDVTKTFRKRMGLLVAPESAESYKLWVAETGWSSPVSKTLPSPMSGWADFSSPAAFRSAYANFLNWDMTLNGVKGPDHVFYFTMRDAPAFGGDMEAFGLIGDELGDQHLCQETKCKIQSSNTNSPSVVSV